MVQLVVHTLELSELSPGSKLITLWTVLEEFYMLANWM